MSKININNYELYAIDYLEGNLPEDLKQDFERFLAENPEIFDELFDVQQIKLKSQKISYSKKFQLKKSPIEHLPYTDYLIISYFEKQITNQQKSELKQLLKNDQISEDFQIYQKIYSYKPQKQIYPYKYKLKRKRNFALLYYAAAVLVLFIGIFKIIQLRKLQPNALYPITENYVFEKYRNPLNISSVEKNVVVKNYPTIPAYYPQPQQPEYKHQVQDYESVQIKNRPIKYQLVSLSQNPYEDIYQEFYNSTANRPIAVSCTSPNNGKFNIDAWIASNLNLPSIEVKSQNRKNLYGIQIKKTFYGVKF